MYSWHRSIVYLSLFVYLALTLSKTRRAKTNTDYINIRKMEITWIRRIFALMTVVFILDMVLFIFFDQLSQHRIFIELLIFSTALIMILYIGKGLLFNWAVRQYIFGINDKTRQRNGSEDLERLKKTMTQEEPYYNPDLTLEDLARIVPMPKRELSELINTHLGKTFLEYINDHRIEAAKRRFDQSEDDKETILEVMYAAGFNSKSTFNTAFKKKTGMTPSAYRRRTKEGLLS